MEHIKDEVLGSYYIQIDEYNYSVYKTITPDGGKPYESCIGHFGNFGSALRKIVENKVRQQSYSSIKAYLDEYKSVVTQFEQTFKP
jgi:hypothetical protein